MSTQPTPSTASLERPLGDVLRAFHQTGRLPEGSGMQAGLQGFEPTLVARYRAEQHRGPYPLVLFGETGVVRTLTECVDDIINGIEEGESGERQKRVCLRLERELVAGGVGPVAALIDEGEPVVRAAVSPSWKEDVDAILADLRARLQGGVLVPFGLDALRAMAQAAAQTAYAEFARPWFKEVDELERKLAELAEVEAAESDTVPEHLRHLAGGAFTKAFDFEALGALMEEAPHTTRMPPERLARIEGVLTALRQLRGMLTDVRELEPRSVEASAAAMRVRAERVALLGQCMTVSRLESRDRFDPKWHSALVGSMDVQSLRDEDRAIIPPTLVWLEADQATPEQIARAGEMVAGRAPYKVLLVLAAPREAPEARGWGLVDRGIMAADTHVGQFGLSDPDGIQSALKQAMAHPGPALVAVYAPRDYMTAAAGVEGRAVPGFICQPASAPWADRIVLSGNSDPERDWTGVPDSDEEFCWADFASLLPSLQAHFLVLPKEVEDQPLVPIARFLELGPDEARKSLPVIKVSADGQGERLAVVDAPILALARRVRDHWHRLREMAGVQNSFARQAAAAADEEHASLLAEALKQAEDRHRGEMDQAVSGLAAQIVSNIAASMLGANGSGVTFAASAPLVRPPAQPAPAEAASEASTEAAEEPAAAPPVQEEEEALPLDEAWIETVRCTSCNECTDLNGMIFGYDDNKQAYIKDAAAGPFRDLVIAAEKCPAAIIHPGKPLNPDEPHLADLLERAAPFR